MEESYIKITFSNEAYSLDIQNVDGNSIGNAILALAKVVADNSDMSTVDALLSVAKAESINTNRGESNVRN